MKKKAIVRRPTRAMTNKPASEVRITIKDAICKLLDKAGCKRSEIVCIYDVHPFRRSVTLASFWKYASHTWMEVTSATSYDFFHSQPTHHWKLLSGKGWWIEFYVTSVGDRAFFKQEPEAEPPTSRVALDGTFVPIRDRWSEVVTLSKAIRARPTAVGFMETGVNLAKVARLLLPFEKLKGIPERELRVGGKVEKMVDKAIRSRYGEGAHFVFESLELDRRVRD